MAPLSPLPTPDSQGLPWWESENATVNENSNLTVKHNTMIMASALDFKKRQEWISFHGFEKYSQRDQNPWVKLLADNC